MVVAVACVGAVGGCVGSGGSPSPVASEVSPSVSVSESVSVEPSASDKPSIPGYDWGKFPPNHLTEVKDLSDPQFPEELSTFVLESVNEGGVSVMASYGDDANFTSILPTVSLGFGSYSTELRAMQDIDYYGKAVCGRDKDYPDVSVCLMVGERHTVSVQTASDVPVGELAALTEELYGLL